MRLEIISISTKLLMGDVLDTNTAYVSRSLRELNISLTCKITVGDDLDMIADSFRVGLNRADVVLAMGGLGDGQQDYTRLAAAQVTGRKLLAQSPGIDGATLLEGRDARTSGFLIEEGKGALICLPGHRRDLGYLLETEVLPYLRQRLSTDTLVGWVMLRTVGVMESSLKQQLTELALDARHRITYDSFAGQTNIRLWVEADSQEQIEAELAQMKQLVVERLGDHIYGEGKDRLEEVVMKSLVVSGRKLALAECYTDQTLDHMIANLSLPDGVVQVLPTSTWHDLNDALDLADASPADGLTRWCRAAAEQLMLRNQVDLGLLVYKNVSQGGVQVLVTLASQLGISVTQRSFGGHPENINQWAGTLGLSHLRRWLLVHM